MNHLTNSTLLFSWLVITGWSKAGFFHLKTGDRIWLKWHRSQGSSLNCHTLLHLCTQVLWRNSTQITWMWGDKEVVYHRWLLRRDPHKWNKNCPLQQAFIKFFEDAQWLGTLVLTLFLDMELWIKWRHPDLVTTRWLHPYIQSSYVRVSIPVSEKLSNHVPLDYHMDTVTVIIPAQGIFPVRLMPVTERRR